MQEFPAFQGQWDSPQEALLYQEHLLLGGRFDEGTTLLGPLSYGPSDDEALAFSEGGCSLCDLSGMTCVLVSGEGAEAFVSAACAQRQLAVGECAFGAVLIGDGSLAGAPLVARTGDREFLLWDATDRGLGLNPWLSFLAGIDQGGFRPFAGVSVEDVSSSLVPLVVWGPQAQAVLGDYVSSLDVLPAPGQVASVNLDRIPCLLAGVPLDDDSCYLVFAPPASARALWRSLLSFASVVPLGHPTLAGRASHAQEWVPLALAGERWESALSDLVAWGLARESGGFVGGRALNG